MRFCRFQITLMILWAVCLGSALPVQAQQTLADADWFERLLGEGVVWRHYLFEDLFGGRQSVSYIEVDLSQPGIAIEFPYRADAREFISSMIPTQAEGAIAGINGTYFNTRDGGHSTYLRVDGNVIPRTGGFAVWGSEGAIALDADGDPSIVGIPSADWDNDTTHPNILACGPLVLIGNTIPSGDLDAIGSHCTSRHPRSAVGITADDRLILLAVDGRSEMAAGMTCEQIGETMQQLGCIDALNLDGGGSTVMWGSGEPHDGVINYPSDNGVYDHNGERSCANAIAIIAPPASPKSLDARLIGKNFSDLMETQSSQTVSLVYENNGTTAWSAADTRLVLSRPENRTSIFHDPETWISPTEPATITPTTVNPGEQATFTFVLIAPDVPTTTVYDEHFMLVRDGVGRFGPADSEAWMKIVVQPPIPPGESFIVESRPGGQNSGWYSDDGMANTSVDTTAPGTTAGIGARYGSTYRSVAGFKKATASPVFPSAGYYDVSVAWGAGSNRRNPITYHVNYPGGISTFQIDQSSVADIWMELGDQPFYFNEGQSGKVEMTNEDIDISGSMFANAFKFQYVLFADPDKSYEVRFLPDSAAPPTIDGEIGAMEWNTAASATSGFVYHNNIANQADEDGAFRMLYSDDALYIVFEMDNQYLPGYSQPPQPPTYASIAGDKINFFLTPAGVSSEPFYRILLSPNRSDGTCYIWSQANLLRTTDANTGADWLAGGEAAFSYTAGRLVVEYSIPWSAFSREGMAINGAPEDGEAWGLQAAISNEVSGGGWEYVNWEPDETDSYVYGNPFGALTFVRDGNQTVSWKVY